MVDSVSKICARTFTMSSTWIYTILCLDFNFTSDYYFIITPLGFKLEDNRLFNIKNYLVFIK